ncbi:MAG: homocysteine S-methyltransferase family protein [Pseudomonadota bacterium]
MLTYVGMETDLIFTQGIDLPGFASYPLLETEAGRARLAGYYQALIAVAREAGVGAILESPTWVANRDRAAPLGYGPEQLRALNVQAMDFLAQIRAATGYSPTLISANIGPRDDAYASEAQMSAEEAEAYHAEQIGALSEGPVDVVTAYTLAYEAEAVGIARAARAAGLPVVISFTCETDGRLPVGMTLAQAIASVDAATNSYPAYYMVNCAHPDHLDGAFADKPWMERVKGVVANASRCSHAELDAAEELDAGDAVELGAQLGAIRARFPHITVLGGCCGTDMTHITEIAAHLGNPPR